MLSVLTINAYTRLFCALFTRFFIRVYSISSGVQDRQINVHISKYLWYIHIDISLNCLNATVLQLHIWQFPSWAPYISTSKTIILWNINVSLSYNYNKVTNIAIQCGLPGAASIDCGKTAIRNNLTIWSQTKVTGTHRSKIFQVPKVSTTLIDPEVINNFVQ